MKTDTSTSRCVMIGGAQRATEVRDLLSSSGVPTKALAHNFGHEKIAEACAQERGVKIVAVYCNDFSDKGESLFKALRAAVSVPLHAFMAGEMDGWDSRLRKAGANKVFCRFPLDPVHIASVIKQTWFPKAGSGIAVAEESRTPRPPPLYEEEDDNQEYDELPVPERPGVRTVRLTDRPLERDRKPSPTPPPLQQAAPAKALGNISLLLALTRHNSPLAAKPMAINIVGKGGTAVELDPRRIKPLPENPRSAKNPGFTDESLRALGENIRAVGQAEEILVCPLEGDPQYDAQLIDGERRQRATALVGLMVWAIVREDTKPEMIREQYLLSVVRNMDKEPHTTPEHVRMVQRFRGEEYEFTLEEVGRLFNKSKTWVRRHELLGRLEPDVLDMLDDGEEEKGRGRRFTSQIALLLVDVSSAQQKAAAEHILAKKMSAAQARHYVVNLRRGFLVKGTGGVRHARNFDSLKTHTKNTLQQLQFFLDMPTFELCSDSRTAGERSGLAQDLRKLAEDAEAMAKRIENLP